MVTERLGANGVKLKNIDKNICRMSLPAIANVYSTQNKILKTTII